MCVMDYDSNMAAVVVVDVLLGVFDDDEEHCVDYGFAGDGVAVDDYLLVLVVVAAAEVGVMAGGRLLCPMLGISYWSHKN